MRSLTARKAAAATTAIAVALGSLPAGAAPRVCAACIKANMGALVAPGMKGRACGGPEENAAARFIASRLSAYRVKGAAGDGAFLQPVQFRRPTYAAPPVLTVGGQRFTQGAGVLAMDAAPLVSGTLAVASAADASAAGKVVVYDAPYDGRAVNAFYAAGAVAVITQAPARIAGRWAQFAEAGPSGVEIAGVESRPAPTPTRATIFATPETLAALKGLDGQAARFEAPRGAPVTKTTYNVLGVIHGSAPDADRQAVLLSAHYDHVGVRGGQVYPGANDDASGTAAVLEFARVLGQGKRPQRTVHFALFGCEEEGGHGARYFLDHPPTALGDYVANLEFEMIGVPDPADRRRLMLTGWERSDLGPTLKAQGASLGPDNYPTENFFQRSDNYQLARRGVVAQTVSAWPVPPTYHQPTDDLAHVDLPFMAEVVQSMLEPVRWLLNSPYRPQWNPGMKP